MSKYWYNDKNKRRKIYKEIDTPYFGEVKLFTKAFLDHYKNSPNDPQNITIKTKKNIKKITL